MLEEELKGKGILSSRGADVVVVVGVGMGGAEGVSERGMGWEAMGCERGVEDMVGDEAGMVGAHFSWLRSA